MNAMVCIRNIHESKTVCGKIITLFMSVYRSSEKLKTLPSISRTSSDFQDSASQSKSKLWSVLWKEWSYVILLVAWCSGLKLPSNEHTRSYGANLNPSLIPDQMSMRHRTGVIYQPAPTMSWFILTVPSSVSGILLGKLDTGFRTWLKQWIYI